MRHSSLAHASSSSFAGGGAASVLRRWHARARANRSISKAIVAATAEGPSCLFVGSIETASKEMLEALYQQARDSYYSVLALKDLWMKHLVALKGACPNCGEEVFAFVKAENSILFPHGTQCHVCQSRLEFRGKVERSISRPEQRWVYGRVYLCPNTT